MAGQITYRLALDTDIDRINAFYNRIYKKNRTYEQFYWEFNSAPAGKAIYVIAEEDNQVVGTQCAIPYYITDSHHHSILTAKSEDTLVSPAHRGKHIFDNMYHLLIAECRNAGIAFIWGFTYADKPFKKLGFEIPYQSSLGLLTIRPFKAATYFYSITAKKGLGSYFKILGLSCFSYFKYGLLRLTTNTSGMPLTKGLKSNSDVENYIKQDGLFGLKLDRAFLDYRIHHNAYSSNYQTIGFYDGDTLMACMYYNITKENVGYIIHLYLHPSLSKKQCAQFIKKSVLETALKQCIVIRCWGFTHNAQNLEEVTILKKAYFVFLNRGISFVGLHLKPNAPLNFSNFVLSRMASQGTD